MHAPLEEPPALDDPDFSPAQRAMFDRLEKTAASSGRRATYARMLMRLDLKVRYVT